MGNVLCTADGHLLHGNIILYANRPFLKPGDTYNDHGKIRWTSKNISNLRAEEMTECLINDWNKVVTDNDTVYHAGDFSFGDPTNILRRLNGQIVLIPGNHDKHILDYCYNHRNSDKIRVMGGLPVRGDKVFTIGEIVVDGIQISISHFAQRVWNKSHFGAIHVYGHSHGSLPESDDSLSMDIGVDAHYKRFGNYSPFTIKEIMSVMAKRKFVAIDHHRCDE
jgi:calcineurin-like phosphoesterase family protein